MPRSVFESFVPTSNPRGGARARLGLAAALCGSLFAVSAASCNKEAPPAAEEPRAPAAAALTRGVDPSSPAPTPGAAQALEAKAAAPAAPSQVSEATFAVALASSGAHEAGKPAEASIVLDAKEPYHVNDKYPYKFKLKPADGLSYAADVVGKDKAKLEKMRVTLPVAFTPQKNGRHTLAGTFSFSVCTEDKCLIEKRELALDIDVK